MVKMKMASDNKVKIIPLIAALIVFSFIVPGCLSLDSTGDSNPKETLTGNPAQSSASTVATPTTSSRVTSSTNSITPTRTKTDTPTHTTSPSPTPTERAQYGTFLRKLPVLLNQTARNPLRIRGFTIYGDVFILIHNATSSDVNKTKKFDEWGDIAAAYAGAVRDTRQFYDNEEVPTRMVVYETNSSNLLTKRPSKFEVTTRNATEWTDDEITSEEFVRRWEATVESQEQQEVEFVSTIDQSTENITYYPNKSVKIED